MPPGGWIATGRVVASALAYGAHPALAHGIHPIDIHPIDHQEVPLAKTPRTWSGARSPSGLKRVRQAARRHAVLGPRRSAAKTYVANAVSTISAAADPEAVTAALTEALSALDRAAKAGAIHANAAARRKSRITKKINAALGGTTVGTSGRAAKQTGKAAAAKAAKARIAAGKSVKAKGAQTAAGKARAALSKTTRAEAAAAREAGTTAEEAPAKPSRPATRASAAKTSAAKTSAAKTTAKTSAAKSTKSTTRSGSAAKTTRKTTSKS